MNVLDLIHDMWESIREREQVLAPPDLHDDPRVAELERDAAEMAARARMLAAKGALRGGPWDTVE